MHARTFPIFNESNQLVRTAGVAEDISIRHEALEQLRKGRGILFSEDIVDACIKVFNDKHLIYEL